VLAVVVLVEGFFICVLQHQRQQHWLGGSGEQSPSGPALGQPVPENAWEGGPESKRSPLNMDTADSQLTNPDGKLNLLTNHHIRQRVAHWERAPNGSALPSTRLAPLRISSCADHMPYHW
jgi:hypothetical protein